MILRRLSVLALMLTGSIATAAPTVNGLTISWPDDGWYQVQRVSENTIVEVCQGGRSCVVNPGEYNVINLTTQQRFDGIIVEHGDKPASLIVVTGNAISWPMEQPLLFTIRCAMEGLNVSFCQVGMQLSTIQQANARIESFPRLALMNGLMQLGYKAPRILLPIRGLII